jgi:hypothetical protein
MPVIFPDGSAIETPEEFESKIKAARGQLKLSDRDVQEARLAHQREMLTKQIEASREKFHTGNLPSPLSAYVNRGNTAGFGIPAAAASAVTAPVTAMASGYDVGLGEAYDLNRQKLDVLMNASPASAAVGNIAAFVGKPNPKSLKDIVRSGGGPSSPIAGVAQKGFEMAGGQRLAELAAVGRAPGSKWVGQILSAFAGGAGAIAATNVAQYPFGEKSAAEVIGQTIDQVKDPLNVGLAAVGGSVAAAARVAGDRATRNLAAQAERLMPGYKASPDQYRDPDGFVGFMMDSLAKSAAGRAAVARFSREKFFDPMNRSLDEIAQSVGLRGWRNNAREVGYAGSSVRSLVATDAAGNAAAGSLTGRAQDATRKAFETEGGVPVPAAALRSLVDQFDALRQSEVARSGGAARQRSGEWQRALDRFKRIVDTGRPIPAQGLANFMQELRDFADFGSGKIRGTVGRELEKFEADQLYGLARQALAQTSSTLDDAYRTAADLHGAARQLESVVKADSMTDTDALLTTVRSADFVKMWPTLQKVMTKEAVDYFRGAYLGEFLARVAVQRGTAAKPQQALNLRAMDEMWAGRRGKEFQREAFDAVVGKGVRGALKFRGMVSDLFLRSGVGRAEGSQTAGRQDFLDTTNEALNVGKALVTGQFREAASGAMGFALGVGGKLGLINSLLNGSLRQALIDTATGVPVSLGSTAPAAMAAAGGAPGIGAAGASAVNSMTAIPRDLSQLGEQP